MPKAQAAFGSMPGGSTTGAPDWRDAAKLRKFLADDIPQWTPSEGAENTRAFLAALREKCSTEIGAAACTPGEPALQNMALALVHWYLHFLRCELRSRHRLLWRAVRLQGLQTHLAIPSPGAPDSVHGVRCTRGSGAA